MKIALISDIHGNLVSLDAVIEDIARQHVDQLICLGDVATLGPQPREVVTRLKGLDCHFVIGNHESDLLNLASFRQRAGTPPIIIDTVNWCAKQLSDQDFDFFRSFLPLIEIQLDPTVALLGFHASPRSNTDMILATTPTDELDEMLAGYSSTVMAVGHTHIQMLRRHKGMLIVNPGSVGEPIEQMPFEGMPRILPWAEYAIVGSKHGVLGVELRRVPIDLDAVQRAAMSASNPLNWAEFWIRSDF